MKLGTALRVALAIALLLLFVALLGALLMLTDSALSIWQRLLDGPALIRYLFLGVLLAALLLFLWLLFRFVVPRRRTVPEAAAPAALDESGLQRRLAEARVQGVDASDAERELALLDAQRAGAGLTLALFGEVSSGKSSLARALLPDADVLVSPLAGSTTEIARYQWQARTGASITLADLPGLQAVGKTLDRGMLDEARRAHAVIFVTDGDLNRQQVEALRALQAINKPLIVTLNKADQYAPGERDALLQRIQQRITPDDGGDGLSPVLVVTIAGGEQSVLARDASGGEREETRARAADVSQLIMALEELLGRDLGPVNALREQALLTLAAEKLEAAETRYRQQRAEQIVRSATRRAVVGALAAVTPGTDIVIQGYLGTMMTRELCGLYGQQPRDLDIESFLDLSQSRVGKALPVSLAIAGNGLKAFPGVGTIAGGLVHAVAYGLIFDAVGRGLAASLEAEGRFSAQAAADMVEKGMHEYLEQGVRRVAKIALEHADNRER